MLAAWHASLETVGQPIANTDFLVSIYPLLGEYRREALKVAAGLCGEDAFDAGVTEEHALAKILPHLSRERAAELANECIELYLWDRLGTDELAGRPRAATATCRVIAARGSRLRGRGDLVAAEPRSPSHARR